MGNKKVYEIANELNKTSKEIIEILSGLNIEVKSHLSVVKEEDVNKLMEKVSNKKGGEKIEEKEVKKAAVKEEPVIIRRNVVVEQKTEKVKQVNNEEVGKIQKNTQKDYNIVYREKKDKPMNISELFGITKEDKKKEVKTQEKQIETKPKVDKNTIEQKYEQIKRETEINHPRQQNNTDNYRDRERNNRREGQNTRDSRDGREPRFNKENTERRPREERKDFVKKEGRRPFEQNKQNTERRPQTKDVTANIEIETQSKEMKKDLERKISRKKDREREANKQEETAKKKSRIAKDEGFDVDDLNVFKGSGNISNMIETGDIFDMYQGRKKKTKPKKGEKVKKEKVEQAKLTDITIGETISVKDLAQELKVTAVDVIKTLMKLGVMVTLNTDVDFDTAFLAASEYGINVNKKNIVTFEEKLFDDSEDIQEELVERPPVVVVMGHVDHGKTSLLDAIRHTNKIAEEAGGITQHIGAYQVKANGKTMTFLDTPGHEAFTSMRARGAKATDLAILVVAANDGVKPQTIEAINHAKAAEIPIIVAINKIDLPGVNPDKIKQEMTEYGLVSEEWGGDTIFVPISAKEGMGIDTLLEMVQLQADLLELKANPTKQAKGTVLEARLDKARGPVVSMLVNRGQLNVGDTIIVGSSIGRIRSMINHKGAPIQKAGPSTPVEVIGLNTVPEAGETFYEVSDEKTAKKLVERREKTKREETINKTSAVTLEDLYQNISQGNLKKLNIVVKADVAGTAEAVKKSLEGLSTSEVAIKVIHSSVGGVTESDVNLAKVAGAIVIAFNVRPEPIAKAEAEKEGIEIKQYSVIYAAIEDVKAAMIGMLDPEYEEEVIGTAEIRETFKISKVGTIAGAYVLSGKVTRNAGVRIIRDNVVLCDSKLASLKRFKDDTKEVNHGYECGIQIEGFNDIQIMDILEVYEMKEIKRKSLKKD